jgi:hypothetical protein
VEQAILLGRLWNPGRMAVTRRSPESSTHLGFRAGRQRMTGRRPVYRFLNRSSLLEGLGSSAAFAQVLICRKEKKLQNICDNPRSPTLTIWRGSSVSRRRHESAPEMSRLSKGNATTMDRCLVEMCTAKAVPLESSSGIQEARPLEVKAGPGGLARSFCAPALSRYKFSVRNFQYNNARCASCRHKHVSWG